MGLTYQPDWNDLFLGAALEPERWPEVLGVMASHTGAARGQLIGFGLRRDVPFNIVTNFTQSAFEEFLDFGGASAALNYRVAAANEEIARREYDSILHEQHYDAVMPTLKSDRYLQWCDDYDLPFGCQTNLVVDRVGMIGLATLRRRSEGRTNAVQRRVFADASHAARRAVRLQERLEGDQARLLAGAFEAINKTAFIIDAMGRVQAMTQSAEEIVASGEIAMRSRYLDARGTPFSLAQAVSALVDENGFEHVRLRIDGTGVSLPLFMEGFRLPNKAWSIGHLPHAILLLNGPQRDRAGIAAFLSAIYRLTATEGDIAMRLFDGVSRADIAAIRKVGAETLRGQIKAICAKTGAKHEADLMRLLGAIMA